MWWWWENKRKWRWGNNLSRSESLSEKLITLEKSLRTAVSSRHLANLICRNKVATRFQQLICQTYHPAVIIVMLERHFNKKYGSVFLISMNICVVSSGWINFMYLKLWLNDLFHYMKLILILQLKEIRGIWERFLGNWNKYFHIPK